MDRRSLSATTDSGLILILESETEENQKSPSYPVFRTPVSKPLLNKGGPRRFLVAKDMNIQGSETGGRPAVSSGEIVGGIVSKIISEIRKRPRGNRAEPKVRINNATWSSPVVTTFPHRFSNKHVWLPPSSEWRIEYVSAIYLAIFSTYNLHS